MAVAELVDCYQFDHAVPDNVTLDDFAAGNMEPGRFGARLENVRPMNVGGVCGRQGFWTLEGEELASVLEQLGRIS